MAESNVGSFEAQLQKDILDTLGEGIFNPKLGRGCRPGRKIPTAYHDL